LKVTPFEESMGVCPGNDIERGDDSPESTGMLTLPVRTCSKSAAIDAGTGGGGRMRLGVSIVVWGKLERELVGLTTLLNALDSFVSTPSR